MWWTRGVGKSASVPVIAPVISKAPCARTPDEPPARVSKASPTLTDTALVKSPTAGRQLRGAVGSKEPHVRSVHCAGDGRVGHSSAGLQSSEAAVYRSPAGSGSAAPSRWSWAQRRRPRPLGCNSARRPRSCCSSRSSAPGWRRCPGWPRRSKEASAGWP